MEDERFAPTDGKAIKDLRKKKGWSQNRLAEKADVSLDSIKRAEKGEHKQLGTILKIATALGVQPSAISRYDSEHSAPDSVKRYTWSDIEAGAKKVGEEIFQSEFQADAVLTFAGPGALFASLVMVTTLLPQGRDRLLNMPVYLALTRDWKPTSINPHAPELRGFINAPGDGFVVYIPEALVQDDPEHQWKIIIIDDSITSGEVPPVLRNFFREPLKYPDGSVKIACCVWLRNKVVIAKRKPDFYMW